MVSNRRAMSACYYAVFHCLARECADRLMGSTKVVRKSEGWRHVYRTLEHGHAKNQCVAALKRNFSPAIKEFAEAFRALQLERHKADYDPRERFGGSAVRGWINQAEGAISDFLSAPIKDRREFCAWVLLKARSV
jgi:hypothetical protein